LRWLGGSSANGLSCFRDIIGSAGDPLDLLSCSRGACSLVLGGADLLSCFRDMHQRTSVTAGGSSASD
jgi:hypothetical protein